MVAERTTSPAVDGRTEESVRRFIQLVLRGGLALAFSLMVAGLVVKAFEPGGEAPATPLFSLGSSGDAGDRLMAVGILVLAVTPAVRVLALIVLWARERDWRYTAVGVVVLVVLVVAAAIGHG